MIVYNFLFFILLCLAIVENKNFFGKRFVPVLFCFIFTLIFSSIRGDVGQDTSNYLEIYNNLESNKEHLESGFYYLSKLIKNFDFSFNWFLFTTAFISLSFYFYSLFRFLGLGLVTFAFMIIFCDLYMYFNMSGLRQGIALSISFLSGYYAYRKSWIKFLIFLFISVLFHKSAIITLLFYPLFNINIKYNFKVIFFGSIAIFLWLIVIQHIMSNSMLLSGIKGAEMYLSGSYNELSISAYVIGIIRRMYPLIFVAIFFNRIRKDHLTMRVLNVYIFGCMMYIINYPILQDVTVRISSYFILFEPILIVSILNRMTYKNNIRVLTVLVLALVYFKIFSYASLPPFQYHFMDGLFY